MTITNYSGNYLKLQSSNIQDVIDHLSNYTNVNLVGNINGSSTSSLINIAISTSGWKIDLTPAVQLSNRIEKLVLKNIISYNSYNTIITPIDLSTVISSCTNPSGCTLQNYPAILAAIKSSLDTFFLSIGVTATIVVTATGNVVSVVGIPTQFALDHIEHGPSLKSIPFGFGSPIGNAFLGYDALYVKPQFFGATTSFLDGVYNFSLKITKASNAGYITEANCAFVDIKTKCWVAKQLKGFFIEGQEDFSGIIHILHYALVNGSNCGCNCNELVSVYNELFKLLSDSDIDSNCGC